MSFFQTLRSRFPGFPHSRPCADAVGLPQTEPQTERAGVLYDAIVDSEAIAPQPQKNFRHQPRTTTSMKVGDVTHGVVSGIAEYGLFVRLHNGETGLVYQTEVCWAGQNISYTYGQRVKLLVIGFKPGRGLYFSIRKAMLPEVFKEFAASHGVDSRFTGRIKSVQDYGVFVTISPGVEGLFHCSNIPDMSVYNKDSIGRSLDVVIMSMDPERMHIQLKAAP